MQFLTEELKQLLLVNGSEQNRDNDHSPVLKLFLPGTGCTWLLSELDYREPTIAFGLCDLGMGFPELGYVSLVELDEIRSPISKLPVERDEHFVATYPMSVYAEAARMCQTITENGPMLELAAARLETPPWQPD